MSVAVDTTSLRRESSGPDAWVYALVFTVATGMAVFIGRQLEAGMIPFAACGFKSLAGLPCPGCGVTRSLAALARLDLLQAFLMNPMVAAMAATAPLTVPGSLLDARLNQGRGMRSISKFCCGQNFPWVLAFLIGINWVYLVVVGH